MQYLTTHDLVWINNVVTGKINRHNYFTLEAAMAGQYSYLKSDDALGQSAEMLRRLLFKAPFEAGNLRTAFIAAITFLNANGYATTVDDSEAARVMQLVALEQMSPIDAVQTLTAPASGDLPEGLTLRSLITHECNHHAAALKLLTERDTPLPF